MSVSKSVISTAVALIIVAISAGALGAHMLKSILTEAKLQSFETAVRYQMFSGVGVLALAALADRFKGINNKMLAMILLGTILFSGSIYMLVGLSDGHPLRPVLGPITPVGGLLMIFGWTWVLLGLISKVSGNIEK